MMIKEKQINLAEFDLKSYDFILQLEVLNSDEEMNGQYIIELEKGSKYLQTISQKVLLKQEQQYRFNDEKGIILKAFKEKNMVFDLSLYRKENGLLQFVDNFKINLQNCFTNYVKELKTHWVEYQNIRKDRKDKSRCENWSKIKSCLTNNKSKHILKNTADNLSLQCIIYIRNQYDRLIDQQPWKTKRQKQLSTNFSERSVPSKKSLQDKKKTNILLMNKTQKGQKLQNSHSIMRINSIKQEDNSQVYPCYNQNQFLPLSSQLGSKLKVKTSLSHAVESCNQTEITYFSEKKPVHLDQGIVKSGNFKRNQSLSYIPKKQDEELSTVVQEKIIELSKKDQTVLITKNSLQISFRFKCFLLFALLYVILCLFLERKMQTRQLLFKRSKKMYKKSIFR